MPVVQVLLVITREDAYKGGSGWINTHGDPPRSAGLSSKTPRSKRRHWEESKVGDMEMVQKKKVEEGGCQNGSETWEDLLLVQRVCVSTRNHPWNSSARSSLDIACESG